MKIFHDIIIIGAGPIGLYFASKCEKNNLDYLVLEGTEEIGGQIIHLYPEKEIVDIPNINSIIAKDYIQKLKETINLQNIVLNEKIINIIPGKTVYLKSKLNEYECNKLVVATGLGISTPRPLGIEGENDASNIIYNINDYKFLLGKKIAIFGGGDSALDWSKLLSKYSNDVHLIHRRTEFRGDPKTIEDCKNLNVHLPFVPFKLNIQNKKATSITIKEVDKENYIDIPVDYIFVNYGNIAEQSSFPFEMTASFINVGENFEITKNIFAIGDVANYENKKRRIEPGIHEADTVFKLIND